MIDVARTLPLVLSIYLRQLLIPVGIAGLYYTPYVTTAIFSQLVVPALVVGAVLLGLWYWNRREGNSTVAFAAMWLLVGLAPALYLRNFGNGDFVRDRYMYLPSIGFSILAALGLRRFAALQGWDAPAVQGGAGLLLCRGCVCVANSPHGALGDEHLPLVGGRNL